MLLQDAVIRRLELIGEAEARVSPQTRDRYLNVPWRSLVGFRNVMIHAYFAINLRIVWTTVVEELAQLAAALQGMLDAEYPSLHADSQNRSTPE